MPKTTSTSAREFRVRWEVDLTADSPEAAARQALEIQRDPGFFATIFEVKWRDPDNVDAHGNGSAHGKRGRKHKLLVDAAAVKAAQKPEPEPLDPAECTVDGRTYVAVESEDCTGCAADQPGRDAPICSHPPIPCSAKYRPDGRSVIWVLKSEPQPQPQPEPEPQPQPEPEPEPQPDNESERTVNGVRLKAVPCLDDFIECRGCYLLDDPATVPAMCYSPSCIGSRRADGQDIIWVRQDA